MHKTTHYIMEIMIIAWPEPFNIACEELNQWKWFETAKCHYHHHQHIRRSYFLRCRRIELYRPQFFFLFTLRFRPINNSQCLHRNRLNKTHGPKLIILLYCGGLERVWETSKIILIVTVMVWWYCWCYWYCLQYMLFATNVPDDWTARNDRIVQMIGHFFLFLPSICRQHLDSILLPYCSIFLRFLQQMYLLPTIIVCPIYSNHAKQKSPHRSMYQTLCCKTFLSS